jgi:uncharacterized protein (TIGR03086 family)
MTIEPLVAMTTANRHRRIAAAFGERVAGVRDWQAQSPVPQWRALDILDHLLTWFPGFLHAGSGITLAQGPAPSSDPVGAWARRATELQALLDDPASGNRVFAHPLAGTHPLPDAIDRFYTADIFMHTWDLARATGQDDALDEDLCAQMVEGMEPMADMLYASGQYGPRVDVPADSDAQTRLLGLIGRDPRWKHASD